MTTSDVQAMIDNALVPVFEQLVKTVMFGQVIALKSSGNETEQGRYLCADDGGPDADGKLFKLTGRSYIDVNETWTLDKGKS
jgi:hypothetical protein